MTIQIDTSKQRILLQWLMQGYIDTDDLPEMKNTSLFADMLMATGQADKTQGYDNKD